ncbi:MAG TPA: ABC transporter ATP-binding protein [Thermoplasmata archaeon]|nr:ABC transporter ATP-binding protein [Thermoplasmata archaeon]
MKPAVAPPGDVVLDIRNLRTYFFTYDGVVKALDGVTFDIRRGETIGLVGETGCGKSVTAFSVTKLIADPPGRIMDGSIVFKGANLLWGLDREARFKPIKKSNRIKVTRRFRAIRRGQERMTAVRGGGISMIFQEPTSAMNPIFSISDQISEALLLHRGEAVIQGMLDASLTPVPPPPSEPGKPPVNRAKWYADQRAAIAARRVAISAAIEKLLKVCRQNDVDALRAAAGELGEAARLPSLGTEAFYTLRGAWADPDAKKPDLLRAVRRLQFSGLQIGYLLRERARILLQRRLQQAFMSEMRNGRSEGGTRRVIGSRRSALRLRTFYYGLWGVRGIVQKPLKTETFWESVQLLEGVRIANPVQVARGFPHELSGGMLQRVMIAMALSSDPELLIADEPTTALDVTIQAQILELMRNLKERIGTAIMLITHDLGVIAEVADRVAVMYAGVIVEIAPVRELYRRPLHPYTQGLLSSIPRMDDPGKKLESIPGSVPNLIYPPSGCRFHPRCPHAMPVCKEVRPPMTVEGEGHRVACYLYHGPVAKG